MLIHEAATRGDTGAIAQELARGLAIDSREPLKGYTPLMSAAASPRADLACVIFLLARGADVNARSWTPATAPPEALAAVHKEYVTYQFVGESALTLAADQGSAEILRALLEAGADVRAATTHGYDALIKAVYASIRRPDQAAPLVALLLAHGASPKAQTQYGESALKTASNFALFDAVALLLEAGADARQLGWTPLMRAVVFGSLDELRAQLAGRPDLEARDAAGRTALQLSVQRGELARVQLLHAQGAALLSAGEEGPISPLPDAIWPSHPEILAWLLAQGCDVELPGRMGELPLKIAVEQGASAAVELLLEAGARAEAADRYGEPLIAQATRREIVERLLAAGADPNGISDAMRQELFGFGAGAPLEASAQDYQAGRGRRFGAANPEPMDIPFWRAMVRARVPAYAARVQLGEGAGSGDEPVWCFARFGRTLTLLPDGRAVEIAGEHEDFYDPDFCIYNDVVVYAGEGSFCIYGYPPEIFPPTDFHTATLVGEAIYIIGSLGYQGSRRQGETPVYRLDCASWAITPLATGGERPGWISRHSARYDAASGSIIVGGGKRWALDAAAGAEPAEGYVDSAGSYALDLATLFWRRLA